MPLTPEEQAELQQLESELGEAPTGLTPEEEQELATLEAEFAPKGFFERVGDDMRQRGANAANINAARTEQTGDETAFQNLTNQAMVPFDILGEGVQSGLNYAAEAFPETAKKVTDYKDKLLNAPTDLNDLIKGGIKDYQQFAEQNPRAARNITAVGQAASVLPVLPAAKAGAKAGLEKLATPKQVMPDAEDLRGLGKKAYEKARSSGDVYQPDVTNQFIKIIEDSKPKPIAGKVLTAEDRRYISSIDDFKDLADSPLSIDEIDAIDKSLGNKISEAYRRGENYDASRLTDVQNELRNLVENTPGGDALNEARGFYSKNYRLNDIERILERAEYTENPATAIQTGFRNLAMNARKMKGYTPEQQKLIQKAAKTGATTGLLKAFGSRLNTIGAFVTTKDPLAAIGVHTAGAASRAGATKLQAAKAGKVAKSIVGDIRVPGQPTLTNKAAQSLLNKFKSGQQVTPAQLNTLPPKDAMLLLEYMERASPATVAAMESNPNLSTKINY